MRQFVPATTTRPQDTEPDLLDAHEHLDTSG